MFQPLPCRCGLLIVGLAVVSLSIESGPVRAGDDVPPVDEIFDYLSTFDFAQDDFAVPNGIGSLETGTGGSFPSLSVESTGKTGLSVNGARPQGDLVDQALLGAFSGNSATLQEFKETLGTNVVFANRILIALGASDFTTAAARELLIQSNARDDTIANSDPYIARQIEVTNPFDVTTTFRFEAALETVGLSPLSTVAEGRFSAEVFDTGGEVGAELQFNLGHTLRQANSLEELSIQVGHAGVINEGELSTRQVDPITGFAVALEDFDRMLSSVFLTLSPGDTAIVTTIGNFGDDTFPLTPLDEIQTDLSAVVAFGNVLLSVPEPSSVVLAMVAWAIGLCRRRLS